MGKAVFCLWPAYFLQQYHTPENNISTETFQTEQFITYNKPPSRDHDSLENTAHGAALPALFLIYWASLYKWVTVSLGSLLANIVHYSYCCY